ncbi:MAG: RsmD family RNA methyltransferase [Thermoanaerobaculia bacterium]|nr:RsmD family RNA methyltransferase [Thermoanaerobaculia bacterium]
MPGIRVTGGSLRGRRIQLPRGVAVRPTSDRARQAYFNIVSARVAGAGPPSWRRLELADPPTNRRIQNTEAPTPSAQSRRVLGRGLRPRLAVGAGAPAQIRVGRKLVTERLVSFAPSRK